MRAIYSMMGIRFSGKEYVPVENIKGLPNLVHHQGASKQG